MKLLRRISIFVLFVWVLSIPIILVATIRGNDSDARSRALLTTIQFHQEGKSLIFGCERFTGCINAKGMSNPPGAPKLTSRLDVIDFTGWDGSDQSIAITSRPMPPEASQESIKAQYGITIDQPDIDGDRFILKRVNDHLLVGCSLHYVFEVRGDIENLSWITFY